MTQSTSSPSALELPDTVEAIEYYYQQGLTDGLPVVPPTPERVGAFLEHAHKQPGDVLGAIPARGRTITAHKVAINSIMAGCLPEYAPVVVTAMEAMCEEDFNLHGTSASTAGVGHLVIVHGPIARELDLNFANNVFGPTKRSNATIGRAIRLILMNVCGSVPGLLDKSTFGNPGKYTYCIAEDEELSPWEPLHVERGLPLEASAVTVFACYAPLQLDDHASHTPEGVLTSVAHGISCQASTNSGEFVVILGPELLGHLREAGWTKKQVKQYLFEATRQPGAYWKGKARAWGSDENIREDELLPAVQSPDDIMVIVAGGGAGGFFCTIRSWGGKASSRSITRAIPTV